MPQLRAENKPDHILNMIHLLVSSGLYRRAFIVAPTGPAEEYYLRAFRLTESYFYDGPNKVLHSRTYTDATIRIRLATNSRITEHFRGHRWDLVWNVVPNKGPEELMELIEIQTRLGHCPLVLTGD